MARYVCTKENPWKKEYGAGIHPDAKLIREEYDSSAYHDDYDVYECPHCGKTFYETIAN